MLDTHGKINLLMNSAKTNIEQVHRRLSSDQGLVDYERAQMADNLKESLDNLQNALSISLQVQQVLGEIEKLKDRI